MFPTAGIKTGLGFFLILSVALAIGCSSQRPTQSATPSPAVIDDQTRFVANFLARRCSDSESQITTFIEEGLVAIERTGKKIERPFYLARLQTVAMMTENDEEFAKALRKEDGKLDCGKIVARVVQEQRQS